MNQYWYTVMFISTLIGFLGGLAGAVLAFVLGICSDLRWHIASAVLLVISVLSLAWGLVYGG